MTQEMETRSLELLESINSRLGKLESRFDRLETRMDFLEIRIEKLEARMDGQFRTVFAHLVIIEKRIYLVEQRLGVAC